VIAGPESIATSPPFFSPLLDLLHDFPSTLSLSTRPSTVLDRLIVQDIARNGKHEQPIRRRISCNFSTSHFYLCFTTT